MNEPLAAASCLRFGFHFFFRSPWRSFRPVLSAHSGLSNDEAFPLDRRPLGALTPARMRARTTIIRLAETRFPPGGSSVSSSHFDPLGGRNPMTPINFSQARQLCTPDELQLVETSRRETLTKLDAGALKKAITQVRRVRDKWRDVSTRQVRRSQDKQGARVTEENRRSQQKAELFQNVLTRLEAQLEQVAVSSAAAPSAPPPARKPPKQHRAQEHRANRAGVKEQLQQKAAKMSEKAGSVSPPVAPPSAATAASRGAQEPSKPAATKKKATVAKETAATKKGGTFKAKLLARKKTATKKPPVAAQPKAPALPFKGTQQLGAKTAAKKSRVQASGLTTRTRGHVSARGKRNQSRRDSRN